MKRIKFDTVLVANRGEIACRVLRTAKRMGFTTVAVYSDADAQALHVKSADKAVHIGSTIASESYLNIDAVISAAISSGAQAIHPGYGFLSENAAFAESCQAAGITFIGPRPESMRLMGLKDAARQRMLEAGVPIVPGYHGEEQSLDYLAAEADKVGYPVMIKARAGGGGKGMRLVDQASDFAEALASAQREALQGFGDDTVLIEKYISTPRHIEIQVFGDEHGQIVHLYERDCSLQRRHQKVIEEAPAPDMNEAVREAMTQAAVKAAQAINYLSAGTMEFIVDGQGPLRTDGFWFMEMNTRLQVEHPVTEAITGVDLVEWQLRVAAGEPLPLKQEQIQVHGYSMEARLYAEDVDAGFLPAAGRLERLSFAKGSRIDTGVVEGDEVLPFYDPMLAKLITQGQTREQARQRLHQLLLDSRLLGTVTNRDFLIRLVQNPEFAQGKVHTGLIEAQLDVLKSHDSEKLIEGLPQAPKTHDALAAVAALWLTARPPGNRCSTNSGTAAERLGLWQLWGAPCRSIRLSCADTDKSCVVQRRSQSDWSVEIDEGAPIQLSADSCWFETGSGKVSINGLSMRADCLQHASCISLCLGAFSAQMGIETVAEQDRDQSSSTSLKAPMPGRVVEVAVKAGDSVRKGDILLRLEAMKMEHALQADTDRQVAKVHVLNGAQVQQGDELLAFEEL